MSNSGKAVVKVLTAKAIKKGLYRLLETLNLIESRFYKYAVLNLVERQTMAGHIVKLRMLVDGAIKKQFGRD